MQLPDDKTVSATLAYVDAKGNPAKVDGVPQWSVDPPDGVIALTVADDGMSATIAPSGLGTAQISVNADADLGDGVTTLTTLGTVEVLAGQAVAGTLSFGEPQ